MSNWQQSSERAVLVADRDRLLLAAAAYEGAALNDIDPVRTQASKRAAQYTASAAALTAALALADRAAELEAALAEEREVVAGVTLSLAWAYERMDDMGGLTRPLHPSASNTKAAQERADEYRAAHRNAAQQEGQDGQD